MLNADAIERIAEYLRHAESAQTFVPPLRDRFTSFNAEAAYAVQQVNIDARVQAGERVVGRKIGLTSLAVQKQLGVDQPDFGALFDTMAYGDNQPIALSKLIQPKVEAEVAIVLKQDLVRERHTFVDVINATDYALAAIEIVDSRIKNWDIKFVDTVADNASSAAFVVGSKPVSLANLDLAGAVMTLKRSNGEVVSRGTGAACLGNPLNAAVWLADRMAQLRTPLRAGDVVLLGALGPMVPVTEPDTYTAEIAGLGAVRAAFV